jgi:predicted ester cyclase
LPLWEGEFGSKRRAPVVLGAADALASLGSLARRWTGRGTHDGELMGIAPTMKEATVSGITMSRLQNGKVVEEWTNWDTLGMLQQLGAVPEMARA